LRLATLAASQPRPPRCSRLASRPASGTPTPPRGRRRVCSPCSRVRWQIVADRLEHSLVW